MIRGPGEFVSRDPVASIDQLEELVIRVIRGPGEFVSQDPVASIDQLEELRSSINAQQQYSSLLEKFFYFLYTDEILGDYATKLYFRMVRKVTASVAA